MKILVIDSGVTLSHKIFLTHKISSYEIRKDKAVEIDFDNDTLGHGTAICGLICKSIEYFGIDAEIIVIKAFLEEVISNDELCSILSVVRNDFDADIINMSFGISIGNTKRLVNLCKEICRKAVIVAAAGNDGTLTIPCSLPEVIGVVSDDSIRSPYLYKYIDSVSLQMAAFGRKQRVAWNNPEYSFVGGNSFACANATGIVANIMQKYGRSDVYKGLKENTHGVEIVYNEKKSYLISHPFHIKRAAIFPLCKETSSLLLFSDMIDFEIASVYDLPISGKIGSTAAKVLGLELEKDYIIQSISEINCEDIDLLIVGHLYEYIKYPQEANRIQEAFNKCSDKVNYYFFDPIDNASNVFSPIINESNCPPRICGGMMHGIHTPVVGVFGTSSKQGKFTLQMQIKREMINRGYLVGHIGTEPEAALLGADSVFPMGYNSTVRLTGTDMILYLNSVIHEIELMKDIDLIIVGCQSGTVPYSYNSLQNITLTQIEFLYGTCPDAVFLCVNVFDSIEYIQRTILFIENAVDTKVIALVIFPKINNRIITSLKSNELDKKKNELEIAFNIPVYVLGYSIEDICDRLISHLSE